MFAQLQLAQAHLEANGDEESLYPVGVKGFRGQDDFDVEETGQPSPVSILEAPFHDEPCETLKSNLEGTPWLPLPFASTAKFLNEIQGYLVMT